MHLKCKYNLALKNFAEHKLASTEIPQHTRQGSASRYFCPEVSTVVLLANSFSQA